MMDVPDFDAWYADRLKPVNQFECLEAFRAGVLYARSFVPQSTNSLRVAAQAVVDRWDTPLWKDVPATACYINTLRATLTIISSATEPAHLAVELAAFREAIRGHIGGEEYALISEVVRAIASRATEPDRNAALTDEDKRDIVDALPKVGESEEAWVMVRGSTLRKLATRTATKD